MAEGWGKVIIGTRLEKQVSSRFFQVWMEIVTRGLANGDGALSVRGKVAHKAANELIRLFLKTEADSLLFLDSDADVGHDIIEQFRAYEPGWEYDLLQAFYCRRGWPPNAIWLKRDELGQFMETFVTHDNWIDDVAVAGTHCAMVRREVFEALLGDGDAETFEWFSYPRHEADSDEVSLSREAAALGFRIGATTAIKAGHISEIVTGWETYQDYLHVSGKMPLIERYRKLAALVGEFTGEQPETVVAKSLNGVQYVQQAWERYRPETPDEVRGFYGKRDNGYLYELVGWNCQPLYERIVSALRTVHKQRALVVGAGLGTEVELLLEAGNLVDVYEVPGVLRDFLNWRFGREVGMVLWPPPQGAYGAVVAVDVFEHVHPEELALTLACVTGALQPGGLLVVHMGGVTEKHPQHYDNEDAVTVMLAERFERVGDYVWRKK